MTIISVIILVGVLSCKDSALHSTSQENLYYTSSVDSIAFRFPFSKSSRRFAAEDCFYFIVDGDRIYKSYGKDDSILIGRFPIAYQKHEVSQFRCNDSTCLISFINKGFKGNFVDSTLIQLNLQQNTYTTVSFDKIPVWSSSDESMVDKIADSYNAYNTTTLGGHPDFVLLDLHKTYGHVNSEAFRARLGKHPRTAGIHLPTGKTYTHSYDFPQHLHPDSTYHNFIDYKSLCVVKGDTMVASYSSMDSLLLYPIRSEKLHSKSIRKVEVKSILVRNQDMVLNTNNYMKTKMPNYEISKYGNVWYDNKSEIIYRLFRVPTQKINSSSQSTGRYLRKHLRGVIEWNLKNGEIKEMLLPRETQGKGIFFHRGNFYSHDKSASSDSSQVYRQIVVSQNPISRTEYIANYNQMVAEYLDEATIDVSDDISKKVNEGNSVYALNYGMSCRGCIKKLLSYLLFLKDTKEKPFSLVLLHAEDQPAMILMKEKAMGLYPSTTFIKRDFAINTFDSFYPLKFYLDSTKTIQIDTLGLDYIYPSDRQRSVTDSLISQPLKPKPIGK